MTRGSWITVGVLAVVLVFIVTALVREAMQGPTFRAQDFASYEECLRGIPAEWRPGSLERSGAEDACHYVHRRRRP